MDVLLLSDTLMPANAKPFIERNFPDLLEYPIKSSRRYQRSEDDTFLDNWWFTFDPDTIKSTKFIIFAGALDGINNNFRIFKVPTSYLLANLNQIDDFGEKKTLYIHMKDLVDLRNQNHLSFREFVLN